MNFDYTWKRDEANFWPVLSKEVHKWTHITCDILLQKWDTYYAFRRKSRPEHEAPPELQKNPEWVLFICHNLVIYWETMRECISRIVVEQCWLSVIDYTVKDIRTFLMEESWWKKITQRAIVPFVVAYINEEPVPWMYWNEISEVVSFTKDTIPNWFAWGKEKFLKQILNQQ